MNSQVPEGFTDTPLEYHGLLGKQYASVAEQKEADPPLVYGHRSGKDGLGSAGERAAASWLFSTPVEESRTRYTVWRDRREPVYTRDQIPQTDGSRYSCATWAAEGYESCAVWHEPVTPVGFATGRAPPFRRLRNTKELRVWSTEFFRPVTLTSDKLVKVRGVHARRYKLVDRTFYAAGNCSECDARNEKYRVTEPFVLPMATVRGGAPAALTKPALGGYGLRDELFEGLPAHEDSLHRTTVAVEPLTGFFVKGHARVEYSWYLERAVLSSAPWASVFQRSGAFPWPHAWLDESDRLSRKDAERFKRAVYLPRLFVSVCWPSSTRVVIGARRGCIFPRLARGFALALACLSFGLWALACWLNRDEARLSWRRGSL